MDTFLSICLGIGLAAATGFRIFIPLLALSIASIYGFIPLSENFQWIGTYPALIVFATASIVEIGAYYIPWFDHIIDFITAPAALIAGAVVMASSITEINPLLKWTLAIIAGSGTAAIFHGATSIMRGASTATTGGLANPLFATTELGAASILSLLAIALPLIAGIIILLLVAASAKKIIKRLRRNKSEDPSDSPD
ncbi:MAG: DUF4126 domain-containing protein [Nitrospirae bacterium]|nr:DUF4126 domain-containing protein [Nitrospirota bacterium]